MKARWRMTALAIGAIAGAFCLVSATPSPGQDTTGTAESAVAEESMVSRSATALESVASRSAAALESAVLRLAEEGSTASAASGSAPDSAGLPVFSEVPQPTRDGLRFNFRGVPVDVVLDYMSSAAGFVIIREADVRGTVDIVSHQPVSKDEAVLLLNTILNQKGLAALRSGRTLRIVARDQARTMNLPVIMGSDPALIPETDEMVTQIIPVQYVSVSQLMRNLEPLLPEYSTITANEASNAILITDTQNNIRTAAEVIKALDTSVSQVSQVRIFKIRRGEASEYAEIINQVIGGRASSTRPGSTRGSDDARRRFFEMMGRGGGPGGFSGRGSFGRGR